MRLYVVNSASLVQAVQKQPKILAMPPLEAKAMIRVLAPSEESHSIVYENVDGRKGDWGFMFMFYKTIHPPRSSRPRGLLVRQDQRLTERLFLTLPGNLSPESLSS